MNVAIETHQLTVAYHSTPVIWDVNLQVPQLGMTGIIGPNGAGKSTLLKAILGIIPKLTGRVDVFDQPIHKACADLAYVPQRSTIDWDFPTTVFDLVLMGTYGRLRWFQRPGSKEHDQAYEALKLVEMEAFANRQIGELSGGQQQRAFLARAFVQQSSIYLLDEPFAGVDAKTEKALIEILHQQREAGKTIVMVHHDLSTVEQYFDHVVLINKQVVASGETASTFTSQNVEKTYGIAAGCLSDAVHV